MEAGLNRAWRVIATGASFVLFGIGGLLLALFVLPVLRIVVCDRESRIRRTRYIISVAFSAFIGFMRRAGVLDYEVTGLEHLRAPGVLVVANHPTLIDVVFLIAFMRDVDCVIKQPLWRNPITAAAVRQAGYIGNASAIELTQRCRKSLQAGNRLIIFPEGTRTRPGQRLHFTRGAANIALHAGADVVPVTIILNESTLTKGERWYHVPAEKMRISISVERPIATRVYLDTYDGIPKAARRLTADLHRHYTARLGAAGRLPENEGG